MRSLISGEYSTFNWNTLWAVSIPDKTSYLKFCTTSNQRCCVKTFIALWNLARYSAAELSRRTKKHTNIKERLENSGCWSRTIETLRGLTIWSLIWHWHGSLITFHKLNQRHAIICCVRDMIMAKWIQKHLSSGWPSFDLLHNLTMHYPTMHHFVTEMYTQGAFLLRNGAIVRHFSNAFLDLLDGSIRKYTVSVTVLFCFVFVLFLFLFLFFVCLLVVFVVVVVLFLFFWFVCFFRGGGGGGWGGLGWGFFVCFCFWVLFCFFALMCIPQIQLHRANWKLREYHWSMRCIRMYLPLTSSATLKLFVRN